MQGIKLRSCGIARYRNSFLGIKSRYKNHDSFKIYIINSRNEDISRKIIDTNRNTAVPVYCLTDLISICEDNGIKYSDLEKLNTAESFDNIVERILRYGK